MTRFFSSTAALILTALAVHGQSEISKIDSTLTATRKYWSSEISKYDSLAPLFKKQLLQQLINPITFTNSLDSLSKHLLIKSSLDKKIKFYSWDDLEGGTWHNINSIAQFKNKDGKIIIQELNTENKAEIVGFTDSGIYEVYDIFINEDKYYLTFAGGTHGSGNQHSIIQIFKFSGDSLVKCKTCFENSQDLVLEYPRSSKLNLSFNSKTNEISFNNFAYNDGIGFYEPTKKIIVLKLMNGVFSKK